MWLFTNVGAVSVVEDWNNPKMVWVRGRAKGHVEAFLEPLPRKCKAKHTPDNDYAYRVQISKEELKVAMLGQVDRIDYTNFKNSIEDNAYHNACSKVWQAFMDACKTGCYASVRGLTSSLPKRRKSKKGPKGVDVDMLHGLDSNYYKEVFGETNVS